MSTNENKSKKAEVTALQAISAEDRKDWISLAFVHGLSCVWRTYNDSLTLRRW